MRDPQVEVLPGTHLVARTAGVLIVVANRADAPAVRDSSAGSTLLALQGLAREAADRETLRTGRIFARLATTWLMAQANEDVIEFGVVTPSDSGPAVFLHGGVTAVLTTTDHTEVLRGRDAGFTVDRVVIPAPAIGIGLFVDEADQEFGLPGMRGVCMLAEGAVPGSGAVLWYGEPTGQAPAAPRRGSVGLVKAARTEAMQSGDDLEETLAPSVDRKSVV